MMSSAYKLSLTISYDVRASVGKVGAVTRFRRLVITGNVVRVARYDMTGRFRVVGLLGNMIREWDMLGTQWVMSSAKGAEFQLVSTSLGPHRWSTTISPTLRG
jgi:hypothetical protein